MLTALSFNVIADETTLSEAKGAIKAANKSEVSFKDDVQPILHDYCISCHSPGGKGTMKSGLDVVKPLLTADQSEPRGLIIMTTVKGDLHDIGKNLVTMMLEGSGFKVVDLGVDLSVEKLIEEVKAVKPQILGLSALLTTTMPEMKRVIEELEAQGIRKSVKVMVGGAPVDNAFARKIGADGYGANAAEAVELARRFMS